MVTILERETLRYTEDEASSLRTELRGIVTTLGEIREELATLRTDMVWIKSITEGSCNDIDELKAFKWRTYGISAGISMAVSIGMYFLR